MKLYALNQIFTDSWVKIDALQTQSVKIYSVIDNLAKMYVLKILLLVMFVLLALLAFLMSPEIGRNTFRRHAIGNYFELSYYNYFL